MNRRYLLKLLALSPLGFILPRVAVAKKAARPAGAVDPTKGTAKILSYVEDGTQSKNPKYKGDMANNKGKAPNCGNCSQYKDPKQAWSHCTPLNGPVKKEGWCMSWAPRA